MPNLCSTSSENVEPLIALAKCHRILGAQISSCRRGDPTTGGPGAEFSCDNGFYGGAYVSFSHGSGQPQIFAGANLYENGENTNTWFAGQFVANSTDFMIYINSGAYECTGDPGTQGCSGADVSMSNGNDGNYFTGDVEEFGIWPSAFSSGQQSSMDSNQRTYWSF